MIQTAPKTPTEILEAALGRERQAYEFYSKLADNCRIEGIKELLEKLRDEEQKHIQMIDKMLTQVRLGHEPV
ncbi:MAG TPA: ferritin family protein [Desulfosalsimonadaceae bacterium]|nr:ferritin family protein [Desulfosalsimonadaceae bacterium]